MSEERPIFYRYTDELLGDPQRLRVVEWRWIGIARTRKSWWIVPENYAGAGWSDDLIKRVRKRIEDGAEMGIGEAPNRRFAYRSKRDAVWSYGQRKRWQKIHAKQALARAELGLKVAAEAIQNVSVGKEPFTGPDHLLADPFEEAAE
ncbi:MAG: hypothetical protein RLZZ403_628 [Pseudomonadota bacterium]|jgi:hypothetical protein